MFSDVENCSSNAVLPTPGPPIICTRYELTNDRDDCDTDGDWFGVIGLFAKLLLRDLFRRKESPRLIMPADVHKCVSRIMEKIRSAIQYHRIEEKRTTKKLIRFIGNLRILYFTCIKYAMGARKVLFDINISKWIIAYSITAFDIQIIASDVCMMYEFIAIFSIIFPFLPNKNSFLCP